MQADRLWREAVIAICEAAGRSILEVRGRNAVLEVEAKSDGSPVSVADRTAARIIRDGLDDLGGDMAVVCEEGLQQAGEARRFWLVDPLDGTREFLRGGDVFSVNVALIDDGCPVFGVVHLPARGESYWGGREIGAWKDGNPLRARSAVNSGGELRVLVSPGELASARSLYASLNLLEFGALRVGALPGALKFCLLASGEADLYPRHSPSCGWDAAAGQAILEASGGALFDRDWRNFGYRQSPGWLNGDFLAVADARFDWRRRLPRW